VPPISLLPKPLPLFFLSNRSIDVLATSKTSRVEFFKRSKTSFLVSDCLIVEHRRISSSESLLDSDYCCIRLDFYISGVISTTRNPVSDSLIVEQVTVVAVIRFPNRNRRLLASILDCLRSFCSSSHRFYDRCVTQSFASKNSSSAQSSIIRRCVIEISRL
jgi:hypothetical protein